MKSDMIFEGGALGGSGINERLELVTPRVGIFSHIEAKAAFSAPPAPKLPRYVEASKSRHGRTVYYFRRNRTTPRIRIRNEPGTKDFDLEVKAARDGVVWPLAVSFVYFIRSGDRVKIGVSKNPRGRLSELRTGSPRLLRLHYVTPGDRQLELELHKEFAADRLNGEWFIYSSQIKSWIDADEAKRLAANSIGKGQK